MDKLAMHKQDRILAKRSKDRAAPRERAGKAIAKSPNMNLNSISDIAEIGTTGSHKPLAHLLGSDQSKLRAPAELSLTLRTEDTLAFINTLNERLAQMSQSELASSIPYTFDLTGTRRLHADAGLLLAATIDRWRRSNNMQFHKYRMSKWDEGVRKEFSNLHVDDPRETDGIRVRVDDVGRRIYVPLFTGVSLDTEFLLYISQRIEKRLKSEAADFKYIFYNGLVESITNVVHHAYTKNEAPSDRRWWGVGAFWQGNPRMLVAIADLGCGFHSQFSSSRLRPAVDAEHGNWRKLTEGKLIASAMLASQRRLGTHGRGNGLREIMRITDRIRGSRLRIWSGKGHVIYKEGTIKTRALRNRTQGTLLLWDVNLGEP